MSDLVKRLRATPLYEGSGEDSDLGEEAADRLEQLEAQLSAADTLADVVGTLMGQCEYGDGFTEKVGHDTWSLLTAYHQGRK